MAQTTNNKKTDLAIRETILGVLKSKDVEGRGIMHSSDFRNTIVDLGFPFGSPVVENILVHCNLDTAGNINFQGLERELARERHLYNANQSHANKTKALETSSGAVAKPYRADLAHQERERAERQARQVQDYRDEVQHIFNRLSHHDISKDDAVYGLMKFDIYPTRASTRVLDSMQYAEVTFTEFVKALSKNDAETGNGLAGATTAQRPKEMIDTMGHQRKRAATRAQHINVFDNDVGTAPRTTKKMNFDSAVGDQSMFKTTTVRDMVFTDKDSMPLLSHMQSDMINGTAGEDVTLYFNSEQKLQREQIMAALRKLDAGELTMDSFQDKLFALGFELPELIGANLRRAVQTGKLDLRRIMKMFDSTILKVNALDTIPDRRKIDALKDQFSEQIKSHGTTSIIELAQIFRKFDTDGNESLCLNEFTRGCQDFGVNMNQEDLRLLFNAFDRNGDGVLQYDEFLTAIRGPLKGTRQVQVATAFQKMNRMLEEFVSLDIFMEEFDCSAYPEVRSGERSKREVSNEFVTWFSNAHRFNGYINLADFEGYYANISPTIKSDEAFSQLLRSTWHLSDLNPPPPLRKMVTGRDMPAPTAKQTHGDVIKWNQEPSVMEQHDKGLHTTWRKGVQGSAHRNMHTDVIGWKNYQDKGTKKVEDSLADESRPYSGIKVQTGMKNDSNTTKSLMAWSGGPSINRNTPNKPSSSPSHQGGGASSSPVPGESCSAGMPYQDEYPSAGRRSYTNQKQAGERGYLWSSMKTAHMAKPPPFGVDPPNEGAGAGQNSNGGVKSLAELMKAKQAAPQSLSNMYSQR